MAYCVGLTSVICISRVSVVAEETCHDKPRGHWDDTVELESQGRCGTREERDDAVDGAAGSER